MRRNSHRKKKMVVGILWDLDGTLVDSSDLCRSASNVVLQKHGFRGELSKEQYHEGSKYITSRRMAFHAVGNPDDPIGLQLGADFDAFYIDMVTPTTVPLFPGLRAVLNNISNDDSIGHGVLSNACGTYVRAVCSAHKLSSTFSCIYGSDDVPAPKPNPDGLLTCSRNIEVDVDFCVYIGDSKSDGLAARAAGMKSVYVSWGHPFSESVASAFDYRASTVEELCLVVDGFIDECKAVHKHAHAVVWAADVVDNEGLNKQRTDNEFWDGRR